MNDEWTNDDTGVGAVIAVGNHVEIWALFAKAINNKKIIHLFCKRLNFNFH